MQRRDNYLTQMQQAKQHFLGYDQEKLIWKFGLRQDAEYIYVNLLCKPHRLQRATGDLEVWEGAWVDGNQFDRVMTLLDLLCDSADGCCPAGQWRSMESFGRVFYSGRQQDQKDPVAEAISRDPEGFCAACRSLGGVAMDGADLGYSFDLFEGLRLGIRFWFGDDEFDPRVRYFWDANADKYLRFETMFYAVGLLRRSLFGK